MPTLYPPTTAMRKQSANGEPLKPSSPAIDIVIGVEGGFIPSINVPCGDADAAAGWLTNPGGSLKPGGRLVPIIPPQRGVTMQQGFDSEMEIPRPLAQTLRSPRSPPAISHWLQIAGTDQGSVGP